MAPHLLIDMPAEGAARLLTLSLLEQLSLHATPSTDGTDAATVPRRDDAYRLVVNRLRGCITLYAEALDSSISRKARRRLRAIARAANALHRVELQLTWLARRARSSSRTLSDANGDGIIETSDAVHPSPQQLAAAEWLGERLVRRRDAIAVALDRSRADIRPLRKLGKRLSTYKTAIRLDDLKVSPSFGALTGEQLSAAIQNLRAAVASVRNVGDHRALRRVRRSADHVVYLLEPVASHVNAARPMELARALRVGLERLETSAIVADALIAGGRRIGALHMTRRLQATVWPRLTHGRDVPSEERHAADQPDEIGRGLLSLAESLSDELAQSFESFSAQWLTSDAEQFYIEVEYIATALSEF